MNFGASEQLFLSRWQQLQIREKTESTASSRCDILRSLIAQLQYAKAANILTVDAAASLAQQYAENYSCIVDIPQEEGGVDNYAENALALTAGRRNESKAWSTSLNKENVMQLDCVKAFIKDSKLARGMHFPEGRDQEVLPLHNRPAPVSMQATPCREKNVPNNKSSSHPLFKQETQDLHHTSRNQDKPSSRTKQSNGASVLAHPTVPSMAGPGGNSIPPPLDTRFGSRPKGGEQFGASSSSGGRQRWEQSEAILAPPGGYNANTNRGQHQHNSVPQKPYGVFGSEKATSLYKKPPVKRPYQDFDDEGEEDQAAPAVRAFKTAGEQLAINNQKKYGGGRGGGQNNNAGSASSGVYGAQKRSLGTRRGLNSKFVPPVIRDDNEDGGNLLQRGGTNRSDANSEEPVDERLKNIEPKMIELIKNEIMDHGPEVLWTDIAGLEFAKKTIKEIVVWPMLRPDIFIGLRGPPKGLLLFGPPGTGKTLIGKCIASQSKSTFFSISASSLTSKWVGEGEKMVRALFAVARVHQPSVIFIDEIDSLLSQRSDGENEGSRRIKTEFLVQLDGASTSSEDRILVVGATNRPQEIDEAARRRFVKRLYIPLPEAAARRHIVFTLMNTQGNLLTDVEIDKVSQDTDGYSGADMANLCREAALGPIRSVPFEDIENIAAEQVRPIVYSDFQEAIEHVRPSVSQKDLETYLDWNKQYGSWSKG